MGAIKLGKIFGIEIRLHFSWVIIFFLVGYSLSFLYFPEQYPRLPQATYVFMGLAATFLFFASILFHEMSHSIVARRNGLPIRFITLFVFGGVSSISREPDDPKVELKMAAAGPAASIVLGIGFTIFGIVATALGAGPAVTGVVAYLAFINILLAVFNLAPGFPLDGGRLLRAVIWSRTGSIQRATKIAADFGRGFAFVLIVGGVGLVVAGALQGVWFVLIGWFLEQAARGSYQQVVVTQALSRVLVRDVMTPDPVTMPAGITVHEAVDHYFLTHKHGGYPVIGDEDEPAGVVSISDVRGVPSDRWDDVTVGEVMEPLGPGAIVEADAHVTDLLTRLHDRETDRLLVVDRDHHVAGIVTNDDIARYLRVQVALR